MAKKSYLVTYWVRWDSNVDDFPSSYDNQFTNIKDAKSFIKRITGDVIEHISYKNGKVTKTGKVVQVEMTTLVANTIRILNCETKRIK